MRVFMLALLAFFTLGLQAQEDTDNERNWLITTTMPLGTIIGSGIGTVPLGTGYTRISEDDYTEHVFGLNLGVSYQVIDNLYAGLNIGYGANWDDDDEYKMNSFIVGPRVRYYVPFNSLAIFGDANMAFGKIKTEYDGFGGSEEEESTLSNFGGAIGVAYFINKAVNIEASLGFDSAKNEFEDDEESTADLLSFRLGFALRL